MLSAETFTQSAKRVVVKMLSKNISDDSLKYFFLCFSITKTRLFKYIENFTTKN